MRNFAAALCALMILSVIESNAQGGFSLYGGLSTPSGSINEIYNEKSSIETVVRDAPGLGYHLGLRARFPLGENLLLSGGVSIQRFPESTIKLSYPKSGSITEFDTVSFRTVQNIIPVAVGVDYPLFKSLVGLYLSGELTYNYITNTLEYEQTAGQPTVPISGGDLSTEDSRVGAGLGIGAFIDLKVTSISLETKYNFSNLIGKKENEPDRNYLTLSLGIAFGGFGVF